LLQAVEMVFTNHLEDDDCVSYFGLGSSFIFPETKEKVHTQSGFKEFVLKNIATKRAELATLLNVDMTMPTGRHHMPRAPRNQENAWAVVLESWFTFPGKINVYFNEAYVAPVGRRDRVTANSPAGTNYFNPGSRVLSWVVKGNAASDKVKLTLIEVVEVNLIVAETFDSFFTDNDVDPTRSLRRSLLRCLRTTPPTTILTVAESSSRTNSCGIWPACSASTRSAFA